MNNGQVLKCAICGNIVELLHVGGGQLICCGQAMEEQKENTVDASHEKHIPVTEKTENGYSIKVGTVAHPMEEAHYIEWIEAETDKGVCKKFLKPGESAEMSICGEVKSARAYCNIHGLWKA